MDFQLSEEHLLIQRTVREFAEKEIAPRADEIDATDKFPADLFKRMAELGHSGDPVFGSLRRREEGITSACCWRWRRSPGFPAAWRSSWMRILPCAASRSTCSAPKPKSRNTWSRSSGGEKIGAFGLTEPNAGSDAGSTRTRAAREGNEWVFNGEKMFITNGSVADVLVVTARTDPDKGTHGISAFILEKGTAGFQLGRDEKKMGLKGSVTSQLFFENCRIPAENLLGKENEGFKQFLTTLDAGRLAISRHGGGAGAGSLRPGGSLCQGTGPIRAGRLRNSRGSSG